MPGNTPHQVYDDHHNYNDDDAHNYDDDDAHNYDDNYAHSYDHNYDVDDHRSFAELTPAIDTMLFDNETVRSFLSLNEVLFFDFF